MSIFIVKSGILDSFQDLGRKNLRALGINPNGVMDQTAARLINILLGNDENEAVLEMHFPAAEIRFETGAIFAVGGADFSAELDAVPIQNWRIYASRQDGLLKFPTKKLGSRVCLAVRGGYQIEKKLGSASTNLQIGFGGFNNRKLSKGDRIFLKSVYKISDFSPFSFKISDSLIPFYSRFPTVRVTAGAEFELLTALGQQFFLKENFVITNNSNRMGFRLAGSPVHLLQKKEMISSAVNFGTIQLLPDGQLIILMADHQTTGGYPRLAHIIEGDLPLAAQLGANDKIGFHLISLREAENLLVEYEKNLAVFKTAIRFINNR